MSARSLDPSAPVLEAVDLRVELPSGAPVVQGVSFALRRGEAVGLVGESGSGKTTVALALLGFARTGMRLAGGNVRIAGALVDVGDESAWRTVRGQTIAHVPQNPSSNLNPSLRIEQIVSDVIAKRRQRCDRRQVAAALDRVSLPSSDEFLRRFPHQLSGGQQQRVLIACALACEPLLLVLDEPTTGLDVVTQAAILSQIEHEHRAGGTALVYVSHDLAVVAALADRVAVMYAGRIVEEGPTQDVLGAPRHPYTLGLVDSIPDHTAARRLHGIPGSAPSIGQRPPGCSFAPRCTQSVPRCNIVAPPLAPLGPQRLVACFKSADTPAREPAVGISRGMRPGAPLLVVDELSASHVSRHTEVVAAQGISFSVARGECLALVGESGSGKTTIARAIAGLHPPAQGTITLDGAVLAGRAQKRSREMRRRCQIVFQNPQDSLNPRHRVGDQIARAARLLRRFSADESRRESARLLDLVRLPQRLGAEYPAELSGGERQRVALARALAAQPDLLICDEITSALDVSVQGAVLEVLEDLQSELELALLFITHNLGVVASFADRVIVLESGQICEAGDVAQIFSAPGADRTKQLIAAVPSLAELLT